MPLPTAKPRKPLSPLAVIALGVGVGLLAGVPLLAAKNSAGFIIILLVPLAFVALWGATRHTRRGSTKEAEEPSHRSGRRRGYLVLACSSLFTGPIAAAIAGYAAVCLAEVDPMDRLNTMFAFTTVGIVAGIAVAAAVALSALFD